MVTNEYVLLEKQYNKLNKAKITLTLANVLKNYWNPFYSKNFKTIQLH